MNKAKTIFQILCQANPIFRKWILLMVDLLIVLLSISIATFVLYLKSVFYSEVYNFDSFSLLWIYYTAIITSPIIYTFTKQYKALSRYSGVMTYYQILGRNVLLYSLIYIYGFRLNVSYQPSFILMMVVTSLSQIFLRLTIRDFVNYSASLPNKKLVNVIIYGAGENGAQLAKNLMKLNTYKIICFLDDDKKLWGRSILGFVIKAPSELDKLKNNVDQILLAVPNLNRSKRKKLIENLQNYKIPLLSIPSIKEVISGNLDSYNLMPISINDLLSREVVNADKKLLEMGVKDKVVLITGAGGSIGSELCKQIYYLNPKKMILFDMNENNLYVINKNIGNLKMKFPIKTVLGNACNYETLKKILLDNKVDVVFHAAAYKHVPLVEINAIEGIRNNIVSTYRVCSAAKDTYVKNVVFISSDKAVRPTNIMGASKRLSELIVQGFSNKKTKNMDLEPIIFSMVRFGNVLDSSGSVVPLFRSQIKSGGPITLTDEKILRYFMTISEASQLVLQSLSLAKGGDLFLLDMGEPVLIKKLAEQMIILSGKSIKNSDNPNGDIEIKLVGLRPGEKLYEELLIDGESLPTSHPLIFRAKEKSMDNQKLFSKFDQLLKFLNDYNTAESLRILKELVPEWKKLNDFS